MKLIIEMRNLRSGTKVGKPIDNLMNLFKKKFEKKLNIAKEKETSNLDFKIDNLLTGFKIIIFGNKDEVKKEYEIIEKEFEALEGKKSGQTGLKALTMIGLSFNYYIEDDNKTIQEKERES